MQFQFLSLTHDLEQPRYKYNNIKFSNVTLIMLRGKKSSRCTGSFIGYTIVDDHLVRRASRANMVIHERVTSFELAPCSPCCIAAGCSPTNMHI
jgi:hypothetical protein